MISASWILLLWSVSLVNEIYSFVPSSALIRRKIVDSEPQPWTLHSRGVGTSDEDEYNDETASTATPQGRRRPLRRAASSSSASTRTGGVDLEVRRQEAQHRHAEALKDPTLLTKLRFSDRPDISPATKRALTEVLGLQQMTEIQAKTYAAALEGDSVLGRARTGTGKTLAFLLPAVERLLAADLDLFKPGQSIGMMVVAPTRELAMQITNQAEALLTFHKDLDVVCLYGGTRLQRDVRLLSGPRLPTILVATPGRLLEHLDNTRIGRRKFCDICEDTQIVVLDEADRLLLGFTKETQRILAYLPRAQKRQTLLFSATVPKKLRSFVKEGMKVDFTEVDCVANGRDEAQGETNSRVDQSYRVLDSMEDYIPTLVRILRQAMQQGGQYKILVFFPASKLVRFFVRFFQMAMDIPVLEIHSRMSQASRTKASDAFRSNQNSILFSSDVSARGVDYPDVSLVIQYGAPSTEDSYIHRLGRTGRAGRSGQGLLVLLPFERSQLKRMRRRGIRMDAVYSDFDDGDIEKQEQEEEELASLLHSARLQIRSGHAVLTPAAEGASKAFLAYYVANSGSLDPSAVLRYAKEFALSTGLTEMPAMEAKIAGRLGLEGLIKTE